MSVENGDCFVDITTIGVMHLRALGKAVRFAWKLMLP